MAHEGPPPWTQEIFFSHQLCWGPPVKTSGSWDWPLSQPNSWIGAYHLHSSMGKQYLGHQTITIAREQSPRDPVMLGWRLGQGPWVELPPEGKIADECCCDWLGIEWTRCWPRKPSHSLPRWEGGWLLSFLWNQINWTMATKAKSFAAMLGGGGVDFGPLLGSWFMSRGEWGQVSHQSSRQVWNDMCSRYVLLPFINASEWTG